MIVTSRFETELGPVTTGATGDGLCLLEFDNPKRLNKELKELATLLKTEVEEGENFYTEKAKTELLEYFNGARKEFSIPLITPGTEFRQSVWKELLNIPYGKTRTYLQQSLALGSASAIRAVAQANGLNRISVIIPCHRVIGTDGSLTGYGGGLERKRWLLEHEKKYSGKPTDMLLF